MRRADILLFASVVALCSMSIDVFAEGSKPINLALWDPVQIYDNTSSIGGVRLNIIYGRNNDMTGLDVGIANRADGVVKGVQWGLLNMAGSAYGWQDAIVNLTAGEFKGFQSGIYNGMGSGTAFQLGWVNVAKDVKGFQLGLLNITDDLNGLQIGILNIVNNKDKLKYLPIVNWNF